MEGRENECEGGDAHHDQCGLKQQGADLATREPRIQEGQHEREDRDARRGERIRAIGVRYGKILPHAVVQILAAARARRIAAEGVRWLVARTTGLEPPTSAVTLSVARLIWLRSRSGSAAAGVHVEWMTPNSLRTSSGTRGPKPSTNLNSSSSSTGSARRGLLCGASECPRRCHSGTRPG